MRRLLYLDKSKEMDTAHKGIGGWMYIFFFFYIIT